MTRGYIEARLESLEETWSQFLRNHYDLLQMKELSDNCEYMAKMVFDEVEEAYMQHKADLKESLSNMIDITTTAGLTDKNNEFSNKINLPQIQIPIFSGKYTEWPTFFSLFDLVIHQNSSLSNIEKLYYLKSHTTGEAELLLRHIPITAENYERCWNLIIKRYNNKRYIANNILNRLFGQNKLSCEDSNGIKQLLDTTNECLDALSNLNIDVSTWDILIVYILMQKLDTESKKQWEQRISYDLDNVPTLKELNIFLEARFRALESLQPRERKLEEDKRQKTNVFAITAVVCRYCQRGHTLDVCPLFCQQGFDTRFDFIKHGRLCYNCLSSYHRAATCKRFNSCQRCRGRHHTLLHRDSQSATWRAFSSSRLTQVSNDDDVDNKNGRLIPVARAILPTALVQVESKKGDITMKALLDQGSQASFVTEKAVELLGLPKTPVEGVVTGVGGENLAIKNLVELKIQSTDNKYNCIVQAYVLNRLTPNLATHSYDIVDWPELSSVKLADPCCLKPGKVDILLGADVYGQVLTDGIIRDSSRMLTAQNTQLGWIISGAPMKGGCG